MKHSVMLKFNNVEMLKTMWKVLKTPLPGAKSQFEQNCFTTLSKFRLEFTNRKWYTNQKGDDNMLICFDTRTEGNTKLSEHFEAKEFACKDKTPIVFIETHLIDLLETIRNHYNSPVIINSAYRTCTWNEKVGGAKYSYHTKGMAADIYVKGVPCKNVALKASELLGKTGGVICHTNFVHVDIRATERYRKGVL